MDHLQKCKEKTMEIVSLILHKWTPINIVIFIPYSYDICSVPDSVKKKIVPGFANWLTHFIRLKEFACY